MKKTLLLAVFLLLFGSLTTHQSLAQETTVMLKTGFNDPTGLFGVDGFVFETLRTTGDFIQDGNFSCDGNLYAAFSLEQTDLLQGSFDFPCTFSFQEDSLRVRGGLRYETFNRFSIIPAPGFLFAANVGNRSFFRMPTNFAVSFAKGHVLHTFSVLPFPFVTIQRSPDEIQDGIIGVASYQTQMFFDKWTPSASVSAVGGTLTDRGEKIDVAGFVLRLNLEHYQTGMVFGLLLNKVVHNTSVVGDVPLEWVASVTYTI